MNLHEYQAKELFRRYHVPVGEGIVASTPAQAAEAWDALGRQPVVAKVQVHAGGRGKAGGILLATSGEEVAAFAQRWLGQRVVTPQTGAAGRPVNAILVERAAELRHERYLALTIDRAQALPVFVACAEGGVAIEELAQRDPHAVLTITHPIDAPITDELCQRLSAHLRVPAARAAQAQRLIAGVWQLFLEQDASLIEINPLAELTNGHLHAVDAKVTIDDNALFRHAALADARDTRQDDPVEVEAQQVGISYVGLDGTIGCLVNGAGLAMATNDIVLLHGGQPANFLDVGGGATVEQVTRAFQLIVQDPRVRAILVNIFGGIMQCDVIAQAIIESTRDVALTVPLVVRLEGTRVEEGRALLARSGVPLVSAADLDEAARLVVQQSTKRLG